MSKNISKILILSLALIILSISLAGAVSAGWFGDDSTGEQISVTTDNSNFHYYGADTLASQDGYEFAVIVDGDVYYLDNTMASKLTDQSSNFAQIYVASAQWDEQSTESYSGTVGYIYPITVSHKVSDGSGSVEFDFPVDTPFSFEYKTGEVGMNDQAKIVTSIYDESGTEI